MGISVVIPVHNSEKFLDSCIESILTQDVTDIEIILVENGSSDQSVELCKKYTEKYTFVKMTDIGPAGVSAARNEGMKLATKEWITFVDSDDYLLPRTFDVLKEPGAENYEVIITGYCREQPVEQKPMSIRTVDSSLLQKSVLQYAKYEEELKEFPAIDCISIWTCWAKFYKSRLLRDNKIEFPCGVKTGEDAAFCFQVFSVAKKVGASEAITYYYKWTEGSAAERRSDGIYENNMKLIDFFEGYRKRYMSDDFPESEYSSYVAGRLIEIVLATEKNVWKRFLKSRRVRENIEKASFSKLIYGKRNMIHYSKVLSLLKIQCKRYMFR